MIEGIYGRDGDGFHVGDDLMANLVMFSKNPCGGPVGLLAGGHNGPFISTASLKNAGLSDTFNPWIAYYEWLNCSGAS